MFVSRAVTAVGRHVEINFKLIHMASEIKTHTFGHHVDWLRKNQAHGPESVVDDSFAGVLKKNCTLVAM